MTYFPAIVNPPRLLMGRAARRMVFWLPRACVLCAKTVQIHWVLVKSVNKEKKSTRIDLHSAARVKQDVPRQLATAVSPLSATLHLFNVRKQDTHFQQCCEPCPRGSFFQFAWQGFSVYTLQGCQFCFLTRISLVSGGIFRCRGEPSKVFGVSPKAREPSARVHGHAHKPIVRSDGRSLRGSRLSV